METPSLIALLCIAYAYSSFWDRGYLRHINLSGGRRGLSHPALKSAFPFLWGLSLDVSMEVRNRIFELFSELYNSKGITPAITALYGPLTWNRNNIPLPSFLLKALLYLETLKISGHMIKKSSGAPPPRRPGAAVRTSPAPRRLHSNSLRSRAAAASPDPPGPGGGTPGPRRSAAPAARPVPVRSSVRPPATPTPARFLCAALPAGWSHLQAFPVTAAAGLCPGEWSAGRGFGDRKWGARAPWARRGAGWRAGAAVAAARRDPGRRAAERGARPRGCGSGSRWGRGTPAGGRALGPSGGVCPSAGTPERVGQPRCPGGWVPASRPVAGALTKRKVFPFEVLRDLVEFISKGGLELLFWTP